MTKKLLPCWIFIVVQCDLFHANIHLGAATLPSAPGSLLSVQRWASQQSFSTGAVELNDVLMTAGKSSQTSGSWASTRVCSLFQLVPLTCMHQCGQVLALGNIQLVITNSWEILVGAQIDKLCLWDCLFVIKSYCLHSGQLEKIN